MVRGLRHFFVSARVPVNAMVSIQEIFNEESSSEKPKLPLRKFHACRGWTPPGFKLLSLAQLVLSRKLSRLSYLKLLVKGVGQEAKFQILNLKYPINSQMI